MPDFPLLFARTLQDANDSAITDWKWEYHDHLHSAYKRPDTGEIVRFVIDVPGTLHGLRWGTVIYLGRNWNARRDASNIVDLIEQRFFTRSDPLLTPPRRRRKDRLETLRDELRKFIEPGAA